MSSPQVSIVIPVYNVDPYLVECLDSVLSQTMRDIQIICIDDGSTDRSPEILDEYAAKDSRIIVLHKTNGGLSSARNAAYPLIRGKYTLFVDSDDYIESTLCEKTFVVAEREQADMTFFLYQSTPQTTAGAGYVPPFELFLRDHDFSEMDFKTLLSHMMACMKLWNTSFLRDNRIQFPEGICFEDIVAHWQALLSKPRMAVVPEKLYWYRYNPLSISRNGNSMRMFDIIKSYDRIEEICRETPKTLPCVLECFWEDKLSSLHYWYNVVSPTLQVRMRELIKLSIKDDEKTFLRENRQSLSPLARAFYCRLIEPSLYNRLRYGIRLFWNYARPYLGKVKRKLFSCFR